MADRRSVILKWVFGGGEAVLSGGVVVVVVRARATMNRDVGLRLSWLLHDVNEAICNARESEEIKCCPFFG